MARYLIQSLLEVGELVLSWEREPAPACSLLEVLLPLLRFQFDILQFDRFLKVSSLEDTAFDLGCLDWDMTCHVLGAGVYDGGKLTGRLKEEEVLDGALLVCLGCWVVCLFEAWFCGSDEMRLPLGGPKGLRSEATLVDLGPNYSCSFHMSLQ